MSWLVENWGTILIVLAILEAMLGAVPNDWLPYRSKILQFLKFLEEWGNPKTNK